jgi:hypothetical protein
MRILLALLLSTPVFAQTTSGLPSLPATSSSLGSIQPDGITTTISSAGVLSSVGSAPPSTPQYIAPQALSGCGIQYLSGLTYTVGGCTYSINGITYASPLTNITLAAADPSNPRIDVIFVDTTQVVQKITGTPGATPSQPVVDPSTQLQLTFVLVNAAATTPTNTTVTNIYLENTEWTSSTGGTSSANVNIASTNNPYLGTKDTEFGTSGSVATTTYVQYLKPASGTENLSNYNALVFYMRNKAAWPKQRSVTVQWFNGSTALGIPVVVSNGAFGWNATTNTTAYQQVSIPTATFGIPGVLVTSVRFTITGTGANLTGFYLDEVTLQGGSGGVTLPATVMNFKGAYSTTATYNPNDVVFNTNNIGYAATGQNTNQALTTTSWQPLSSNIRDFGTTFGDTTGVALSSGSVVYFTVPYACTIKAWNMAVDAGTATIDIWKIATGTAIPTVTNTITASALPAIASGTALHSTTLTAWTTAVAANDIFGFQLKTVATAKFVEIDVQCNQ